MLRLSLMVFVLTFSGPLAADLGDDVILLRNGGGLPQLHFGGVESSGVNEDAKLLAGDGSAEDRIGWSVAVLGDTVFVGSAYDDDNGENSGSVYVFRRPSGGWSGTLNHTAKLVASDGAPHDLFGWSVAISGNTVVASAYNDGPAYVFVRPPGGWAGTLSEAAKLLASDGTANNTFGHSVAIAGDVVAIGAFLKGEPPDWTTTGATYIFEKPPGGWSGTLNEVAKLLASDGASHDYFGWSVAASGEKVVVGATEDDDNGDGSGSAYVFVEPTGGWAGTLNETAKLVARLRGAGDDFGTSVAISGELVVVGAPHKFIGPGWGAAYVFEKPAGGWAGTLNEAAMVLASDVLTSVEYGMSVGVSGDTVVVGASSDEDNGYQSGAAYIFRKPPGGWFGILDFDTKLLPSDGAESDNFGLSIAISEGTVVAGAYRDDDLGTDSGSAYVFELERIFADGMETGDSSAWSRTVQ